MIGRKALSTREDEFGRWVTPPRDTGGVGTQSAYPLLLTSPGSACARARGHQLGELVDRHARAAKHRIPAHDLAYQAILGRRSGRAD